MNFESMAAGASAMAFFGWTSYRADCRFILGLKLMDPIAAFVTLITLLLLAFAPPVHSAHELSVAILLGAVAVCAITDIQSGYVLDAVTLPAFVLLLACAAAGHGLMNMLTGSIVSAAALLTLFAVSRGRGIGLGDVKLVLCTGAVFGSYNGLFMLAVAFVLGGCVAVMLLVSGKAKRGTEIRFAPFIAIASGAVAVLAA